MKIEKKKIKKGFNYVKYKSNNVGDDIGVVHNRIGHICKGGEEVKTTWRERGVLIYLGIFLLCTLYGDLEFCLLHLQDIQLYL